jgi:oxalate decarboxylase/phosphoglucose isomerase-like protein (cupin superfamily)
VLVDLPEFRDPRGSLLAVDFADALPFTPVRAFAVYDVPRGTTRADHANLSTDEAIVCLSGRCTVVVRDGHRDRRVVLGDPRCALVVPAGLWVVCRDFSEGAVLLVLASAPFDPADQVTDFDAYRGLVGAPDRP